jgi:hypothetical protein
MGKRNGEGKKQPKGRRMANGDRPRAVEEKDQNKIN